MTATLLNPACDTCNDCDPCEPAPSRTSCQYRSGTNGETVTTRPTVAITVTVTGGGSPACGGCSFTEYYTYDCANLSDTIESCSFTGTWPWTGAPDDCIRSIEATVNKLTTGFQVDVYEKFLYPTPPGPGQNSFIVRRVRRTFTYNNFSYTDCDGNPQTDVNGSVNFTGGTYDILEGFDPGESKCNISVTIAAVNN